MPTTLNTAIESYLRAKPLSRGTHNEYRSTLRKWEHWGAGAPIEELQNLGAIEVQRQLALRGFLPNRFRPVQVGEHLDVRLQGDVRVDE